MRLQHHKTIGPFGAYHVLALSVLILGSLSSSCTKDNPLYCDADQDCVSGHCDLDQHRCVVLDGTTPDVARTHCDSADDCTDPDHPVCHDHECVGPCGDGILDPGEVCDGTDVGSETCDSQVPGTVGELGCNADCSAFDTSTCHLCGDGNLDGPEVCDGDNLGGQTCDSIDPGSEGTLACLEDCSGFDRSNCHRCGNGLLETTEECDATDFGGQDCSAAAGLETGDLVCRSDCTLDTSQCYTCGNGIVEGPEVCDGDNLAGKSCADYGHVFGDLHCTSGCLDFDPSDCHSCGNHLCELDKGESSTACPEDCAWTKVVAGNDFSCGLKADGTLWCWGSNHDGELGIGTTDGAPHSEPVQVTALGNSVTDVAAGLKHVCVVTDDARVACWGYNDAGQTGVDENQHATVPSPTVISAITSADEVYAGTRWSCAHGQVDGGTLYYCWGDNFYYQLGRQTPANSHDPLKMFAPAYCFPTQFYPLSGFHACAAFTCGLPPSLTHPLMCWGANGWGQLGDGSTTNSYDPVTAMDSAPQDAATGFGHSCALLSDGHVKCWGHNNHGQLGDHTTTERHSPVSVYGVSNCTAIWAGPNATCALCPTLRCWGYNEMGQLGLGDTTNKTIPTPTGLTTVLDVALGTYHACFLEDGQTLTCSGRNSNGQLGDGTTTDSSVRVAVVDPYQ